MAKTATIDVERAFIVSLKLVTCAMGKGEAALADSGLCWAKIAPTGSDS